MNSEPTELDGGNKQTPSILKFQCKNWAMTWNNYPITAKNDVP